MLMKVYAPDGTMFEVTSAKARELIVERGWRTTKEDQPVFVAAETEAEDAFISDDDEDELLSFFSDRMSDVRDIEDES